MMQLIIDKARRERRVIPLAKLLEDFEDAIGKLELQYRCAETNELRTFYVIQIETVRQMRKTIVDKYCGG